jgi:tRNA threonylcarbamoyladenosine biosynthesis protein TsaE
MTSKGESIVTFQWHNLEQMGQVATSCAVLWEPPAVVLLEGDLGVGKTALIQAVLKVWGVTTGVKSPTFDLVHLYHADTGDIYHADLYRIQQAEELEMLDLPDARDPSTLLVEWGRWLRGWYPDRWDAHLTVDTRGSRIMTLTAVGEEPIKRMITWEESMHENPRD